MGRVYPTDSLLVPGGLAARPRTRLLDGLPSGATLVFRSPRRARATGDFGRKSIRCYGAGERPRRLVRRPKARRARDRYTAVRFRRNRFGVRPKGWVKRMEQQWINQIHGLSRDASRRETTMLAHERNHGGFLAGRTMRHGAHLRPPACDANSRSDRHSRRPAHAHAVFAAAVAVLVFACGGRTSPGEADADRGVPEVIAECKQYQDVFYTCFHRDTACASQPMLMPTASAACFSMVRRCRSS
jgi:hypothetical protein